MRLFRFLRREQWARERERELRAHLEIETDEFVGRGMSREEAGYAARRKLGNVTRIHEEIREMNSFGFLETLMHDLRYAARVLRLNPIFTIVAVLSLALGIGANTAIFQLLDALLLRMLPVKNAQEIARVAIDHRRSASGSFVSRYPDLTYAMWEQIQKQQQGFSSVFAWGPNQFNISPGGEVHNVQGLWVSGEFFDTLEVNPLLGRLLGVADDQPGCGSSGAVISYSFWQREYGGDRTVIGRSLSINRHPFSIIGVTPASFYGVEVGRNFDVAIPVCAEPQINGEYSRLHTRSDWWLSVMGRLKPGWTMDRAATQLRAISPGLFEATLPENYNPSQAKHFLTYRLGSFPCDSGVSGLRREYGQPLWLLLILAAMVLLIASANLANLLLAKASTREKEMGMRMALGASRGRLIRQLLAESLLLAATGALLGGLLARNLSHVLVASISTPDDPLFMDTGTDWRVLAFAAALAVLTCILFGLTPAFRATSVSPGSALQEAGRSTTPGRARFRLRHALVVTQVALAMILLVGALLFSRSLNKLANVDAGFRQDGVLVTDIDYTELHLSNEARLAFAKELLRNVRAIPGVDAAATAAIVPLSGNGMNYDILWGISGEPEGEAPAPPFNRVSAGYFDTLRTPILAGRDFDDRDSAGSPNVAIVNEAFAKQFAKGENPVGMTFRVRAMAKTSAPYQVIGFVKDTKYAELREDFQPIVYTATAQYDRPETDVQIVIRSRSPLASVVAGVKGVAENSGSNLDVTFTPFRQMVESGLLRDRLMAKLSGFFGLLAMLLAMIGLYGVISYMVTRRRVEIGIRIALGADKQNIMRLILREAVALLVAGLGIGTLLAIALSKTAASMLFGLKPTDAPTFASALAILTFVALVAALLPALRAARLDPMTSLRQE
jgi:putative ABC transport system permease protein